MKKICKYTYLHSELADHTRLKFERNFPLVEFLVYSCRVNNGIFQIDLLCAKQVYSKIRFWVETHEPLVEDLFNALQNLLFKHPVSIFWKIKFI